MYVTVSCGALYFAVHVLSTWYSRRWACASMWFWQQVCAALLGCSQDDALQGDLAHSLQREIKKITDATAEEITSNSAALMDREPAPLAKPAPLAMVRHGFAGGFGVRGPGIPCAADHVVHLSRYNHE